MQTAKIAVERREDVGTGVVNRLRQKGLIPGVIYGNDIDSISLSIPEKELRKVALGSGQIIKVELGGEGEHNVLIREYQRHPLTQKVTHVDFFKVSMTEKLTTTIALHLTGQAKGISAGGILQFELREVEIECLPADIIEKIEVDVSDLDIGDMVKIEELTVPEEITILTDPEQIIASVVAPQYEEEEEDEEEADEMAVDEETPDTETETTSEEA